MTSSSSVTSKSHGPASGKTPLGKLPIFSRIEPEWRGQIAVCAAAGPSLHEDDLLYARQRNTRMIAVNDASWLAPWAVLYAPDGTWWQEHKDADWPLRAYSVDPIAQRVYPATRLLNYRSGDGLSLDPTTIRTGGHGGYQAVNLAVHFRPRRIVLIGYDASGHFADYNEYYRSLIAPLADLGIEIVNASRVSAIDAFPRVTLADALAG